MPRPITAHIDISAMRDNLRLARQRAPRARIWAVVKANAYGHGLERGMRAFAEADGLALIEPENAVRLREMGWRKPVLLLEGFFDAKDLATLARHDIQFAVHCDAQIDMIEKARLDVPLDIHLKMNSGMNRLGFTPQAYATAWRRLKAIPAIRSIVLMTHFANADDAANTRLALGEQLTRFDAGARDLPGLRSLANSAAILLHSEVQSDWIRPGIMLYGATPGGGTAGGFGLKPAMTLVSEIIGVQTIAKGEAVGYGSRFVAERPTRVGVVACGYADGYPRHALTGTPVLVNGQATGTLGRVSMDMMAIDLTDVPQAGIGSPVVLWGEGLPIDDVAEAAGTIGYELMCALAPRVRIVERS